MNYSPEQLQELKVIIEGEIAQINMSIAHLEEATQPIAPDNSIGRLTRMDAIGGKGVNDALLENIRKRLQSLQSAYAILLTEQFGKCNICKQIISFARMKAIPETKVCTNCAR